jgi:hypothetical protein
MSKQKEYDSITIFIIKTKFSIQRGQLQLSASWAFPTALEG